SRPYRGRGQSTAHKHRRPSVAKVMRLLPGFLLLIALTAVSYPAAAATNWFVDGTLGNDANTCTAPGLSACRTIQAAINKASTGDTINVAAGTYPEPAGSLNVNKTLTLLGAQNGVDARGRVGLESIITDPNGTVVSANNVVIDGFTVQ